MDGHCPDRDRLARWRIHTQIQCGNTSETTQIRSSTIHHSLNGTFAIRIGDWKLIEANLGSGGFSAPRVVKPTAESPAGQLYNLKNDPSETENLWEKHPEVVARMLAELNKTRDAGPSR